MKIAIYTVIPSPHQLPLAHVLVRRVGADNFRYVSVRGLPKERENLGWGVDGGHPTWCISAESDEAKTWLEVADVVLSGERDVALFERRAAEGRRTFYMSERWFKPPLGILRLLHPRYFKMAWRLIRLVRKGAVTCLPIGIWAARDLARLDRLLSGNVRGTLSSPELAFDARPTGKIAACPWMRLWGYFVASSSRQNVTRPASARSQGRALRVLWVGRMLAWKRVDTLFKASGAALEKIPLELTIAGDGSERSRLEAMARELSARHPGAVRLERSVPIAHVRELMAQNDVYVLTSNAYEGWGAVVSEALEEGMEVFGTYEAGSSATILPKENLHHSGDWKTLARQLTRFAQTGERRCRGIGAWSATAAADALLQESQSPLK